MLLSFAAVKMKEEIGREDGGVTPDDGGCDVLTVREGVGRGRERREIGRGR